MTTKTCAKCGADKPLGAFRNDRRGEHGKASTCIGCPGKGKGGAEAVNRKGSNPPPTFAKPEPPPNPPPVTITAALEVPPGLGFRASLEDSQLVIEQDRPDGEQVYTHQVTLSPSEARALVDWIAERVAS